MYNQVQSRVSRLVKFLVSDTRICDNRKVSGALRMSSKEVRQREPLGPFQCRYQKNQESIRSRSERFNRSDDGLKHSFQKNLMSV